MTVHFVNLDLGKKQYPSVLGPSIHVWLLQ